VSYFATAIVRSDGHWSASEVSLTDAADVEDVADRLRDADPTADVSLLFVESDDAYLAILRLDAGEDLRVFGSDAAFAEESRVGALLLGDLAEPTLDIETELGVPIVEPDTGAEAVQEPDNGNPAAVDPAGDPDLLDDLGMPAPRLLELCAHEGMLPADIVAEVCTAIGAGEEVEELRDA
jgi:putative tRNA adenosine deaminase-associated protein